MHAMRVYLDNVAVSGRVRGDLAPEVEMAAIREIDVAHRAGRIKRVTSQESVREQSRTRNPVVRAKLEAASAEVSVVSSDYFTRSQRQTDSHDPQLGAPDSGYPGDEELFKRIVGIGLMEANARHLVNAVVSKCVRFITLDPDFLDRRAALEAGCSSIKIMRPTEFTAELRAPTGLRRMRAVS